MTDDKTFLDYSRVGLDVADIGESCKLDGKPGAGKTTESFGRMFQQVIDEGLHIKQTGVVTYRKKLAQDLIKKMKRTDAIDTEDLNLKTDIENWGTAHAVAKRIVDWCDTMADPDEHFAEFCEEVLHVNYHSDDPWADTPGKLLRDVFNWILQNYIPATKAGMCPRYDNLVQIWDGHPNVKRVWNLWQGFKENTEDYSHDEPLYDFEEVFYAAIAQEAVPDVEILVIDELHDAYPAMFKMLDMWAKTVQEEGGTVIVAGDPLQVINRHQGADSKYFEEFDLPEIHLPISYRVPEEHWAIAKDIISKSFDTPDIKAARDGGYFDIRTSPTFKWRDGPVIPRERGTPSDLLDEVPDWVIEDAYDNFGLKGNSEGVMFLARTRQQAYCLAMGLRREGILFSGSGGTGAWSWDERAMYRTGLYNLLQKLKHVTPNDAEKWGDNSPEEKTVSSPPVRGEEILALARHLPAKYLIQERENVKALGEYYINSFDTTDMADLVRFLDHSFWDEMTEGYDSTQYLIRYTDALDGWIRPALENNERAIDPEKLPIEVNTIHASKGGEAEWVFLYDGVPKTIKDENLMDPAARKNEDRVWYVATTRAKHGLVVLRNGFDWTHDYITK